jgi:hypothetical protein
MQVSCILNVKAEFRTEDTKVYLRFLLMFRAVGPHPDEATNAVTLTDTNAALMNG